MKQLLLFFVFLTCLSVGRVNAQWTRDSSLNTLVRDTAGLSLSETKIATAANGRSFISWAEPNFNAPGYQYRLQLLDTNGIALWPARGIAVDTAIGSTLYRYDLKADKEGNAIIALQDRRSGPNLPVVFKVNQTGTMLWGANGIQLQDTAATSGLSPVVAVTDSNHVLVSWTGSGVKTISSTVKISSAGNLMWADNIRIIDRITAKKYERGAPLATGGEEFILQYVERSGSGLGVSIMYAMRYNGAGTPLWTTPTQVSNKSIPFAYFPNPVTDGYGGFLLTFNTGNPANATLTDVYVQRVYADGRTWDPAGIEALTGTTTIRFDAGAAYVPPVNKYLVPVKVSNTAQSAAGIFLQTLDTAGNRQLGTGGVQLVAISSGAPADIINVTGSVRMDSSIAVVYQIGSAPSPVKIRAIKADQYGTLQWQTTGGLPVSVNPSHKSKVSISEYIRKQLIITWTDDRLSSGGAYAQNIFAGGTLGLPPCEQFVLTPATLPDDTTGYSYGAAFSNTGGVGALTYTITFGVLPPGITMSSAGVFSGTPTDQGTYPFVIKATDVNGCSNNYTYSITVHCRSVALAAFPSICDTVLAYPLTGGTPAGGNYTGQNVFNGTFNALAAGPGAHIVNYTFSSGSTNPCLRTVTQTIQVVHCATGINNVSGNVAFRVYPNPTNGQINLRLEQAPTGQLQVRLISLTGQVILLDEARDSRLTRSYDLSAYPKGIYMLEVAAGQDRARTKISLQ